MCRLRNIAMRDFQERVTTEHTHAHTDIQTDGRTHRQTPDKVIPMCRYGFAGDTKMCILKNTQTLLCYITYLVSKSESNSKANKELVHKKLRLTIQWGY